MDVFESFAAIAYAKECVPHNSSLDQVERLHKDFHMFKYFTIPFQNVPSKPNYTVWYATWSNQPPAIEPGMSLPVVIGVTKDDTLPPSATLLVASGTKEPPPPPPPLPPRGITAEYQASFSTWLASVLGA